MAVQTDLEPVQNSVQMLVAVKRDTKWQLAELAVFQNMRATHIGRPEQSRKLIEELNPDTVSS